MLHAVVHTQSEAVGYVLECAEEVAGLRSSLLPRLRAVLDRAHVSSVCCLTLRVVVPTRVVAG